MKRKKIILEIPWINGVIKLPKWLITISPALAGFFEESFFRGVILIILLKVFLLPFWVCLIYVTFLFVFQQLLQTKTLNQAVLIGSSCIAISLSGSLLVFLTNSILPAAIAHAAFVIFFFKDT